MSGFEEVEKMAVAEPEVRGRDYQSIELVIVAIAAGMRKRGHRGSERQQMQMV